MDAKEVINRIFKNPKTKYELTEFENLGSPIEEILEIFPKVIESGREMGKTKYFVKSVIPFPSGKEKYQINSVLKSQI